QSLRARKRARSATPEIGPVNSPPTEQIAAAIAVGKPIGCPTTTLSIRTPVCMRRIERTMLHCVNKVVFGSITPVLTRQQSSTRLGKWANGACRTKLKIACPGACSVSLTGGLVTLDVGGLMSAANMGIDAIGAKLICCLTAARIFCLPLTMK